VATVDAAMLTKNTFMETIKVDDFITQVNDQDNIIDSKDLQVETNVQKVLSEVIAKISGLDRSNSFDIASEIVSKSKVYNSKTKKTSYNTSAMMVNTAFICIQECGEEIFNQMVYVSWGDSKAENVLDGDESSSVSGDHKTDDQVVVKSKKQVKLTISEIVRGGKNASVTPSSNGSVNGTIFKPIGTPPRIESQTIERTETVSKLSVVITPSDTFLLNLSKGTAESFSHLYKKFTGNSVTEQEKEVWMDMLFETCFREVKFPFTDVAVFNVHEPSLPIPSDKAVRGLLSSFWYLKAISKNIHQHSKEDCPPAILKLRTAQKGMFLSDMADAAKHKLSH
jgi:hypothetical protein